MSICAKCCVDFFEFSSAKRDSEICVTCSGIAWENTRRRFLGLHPLAREEQPIPRAALLNWRTRARNKETWPNFRLRIG